MAKVLESAINGSIFRKSAHIAQTRSMVEIGTTTNLHTFFKQHVSHQLELGFLRIVHFICVLFLHLIILLNIKFYIVATKFDDFIL